MTRHGRNNTASACYTYHERQRDAKASGYGTTKARLGKDSVKDFDACCLTLQSCKNPVITPEGYIYDKEAILKYILTKKKENIKKTKEFEKNLKKNQKELQELAEAETRSQAEAFAEHQKVIASKSSLSKTSSTSTSVKNDDDEEAGSSSSISNMADGRDKKLPSFWIPSEAPTSNTSQVGVKKPDMTVYCPMSGKPLKMSHLYDVVFTPIDRVATGDASRKEKYMCPVTHDILSNSTPCTFLKTSGSVVTSECIEKIIKKDMMDPLNGKKLKDSDLIPVQRGGTGYALTNQVEASITKPSIQA